MPRAAPRDTCPQPANTSTGQTSRKGRGRQQQQQRPKQQQKSREMARGGWEQHDGLDDQSGSVSQAAGLEKSGAGVGLHVGGQFKGPAHEAPPRPTPWRATPPGP